MSSAPALIHRLLLTTTTLGSAITAVQDLGNGTERVTVRSTAPYSGNAKQFFRLNVTAN